MKKRKMTLSYALTKLETTDHPTLVCVWIAACELFGVADTDDKLAKLTMVGVNTRTEVLRFALIAMRDTNDHDERIGAMRAVVLRYPADLAAGLTRKMDAKAAWREFERNGYMRRSPSLNS